MRLSYARSSPLVSLAVVLGLSSAAIAQEQPAEPPPADPPAPEQPARDEAPGEAPGDDVEVVVPPSDPDGDGDLAEAAEALEDDEIRGLAEGQAVEPRADGEELTFYGTVRGEYRLRFHAMSDIPLTPLPEVFPGALAQNFWATQWFRIRGELGLRPHLKVIGQIDLFDGVLLGETTQGVAPAERPRDDYSAFPGVDPRWLYLEWLTPVGLVRAGLTGSHWGLGILANDGDHEPVFGDYEYGDRVIRLGFGTKPFGRDSDFTVALAGDVVFDDVLADLRDDDLAFHGVFAAFWKKDEREIGLYTVYRSQRSPVMDGSRDLGIEDELDVFVGDVHARWDTRDPAGGLLFAAVEAAFITGRTTATRTILREEFDVRQQLFAAQLGRKTDHTDVVIELGYASGDSNTEDDTQRRGVFDPDHEVGLLLFPEVLAWMSARSAALASAEELFGRPSPGSDLLPTNGGVSGAIYLFPHAIWRMSRFFESRFGAVWALASSDVVDPYRQRAESRTVNYRGGDARNRDLGLELDYSLRVHGEMQRGIGLEAGIEAAVFFPGHAFDDANGDTMDPVGLGRVRLGIFF